jgi:hypothetical protein
LAPSLPLLRLFRAPARLSLSEIHVLQHRCYRNAAVTIYNQKEIHSKNLPQNPKKISSKKSYPKSPRCENGIDFQQNSPRKIPKEPFPQRSGNTPIYLSGHSGLKMVAMA